MPVTEQTLSEWQRLAQALAGMPHAQRQVCENGLHTLIHDLNQNLGIVLCAEELLRRTLPSSPDTTELLDSIQQASREAIELARQFSQQFGPPAPEQA